MYCKKCGSEIGDDSVFCPVCGNSVRGITVTKVEYYTPVEVEIEKPISNWWSAFGFLFPPYITLPVIYFIRNSKPREAEKVWTAFLYRAALLIGLLILDSCCGAGL